MAKYGYHLIFDAATQSVIDTRLLGIFALIIAVAVIGIFFGRNRSPQLRIVTLLILFLGGCVLSGFSIYHRTECRRWARTGDYQVVEGPVENFTHTRHSGSRGSGYVVETFSVGGVPFRFKSGIDAFHGGFHMTDGPIQEGVPVKIAYKEGQILKLWIAIGNDMSNGN